MGEGHGGEEEEAYTTLEEIEQEHAAGQLREEDYERLKAMHEGMLGKR